MSNSNDTTPTTTDNEPTALYVGDGRPGEPLANVGEDWENLRFGDLVRVYEHRDDFLDQNNRWVHMVLAHDPKTNIVAVRQVEI